MFNFFKNKQNQEDGEPFGENNLQESLTNRGLIGASTDRTEWSFSEQLKEKDILENKPAFKPGKSDSCGALGQDSKKLLSTIETLEKQNKQYQQDLNTQRFEYDKVMMKLKKYKDDKKKLTTTVKSLEQQNLALLKKIKELERPLKQENNQEEEVKESHPLEKSPKQEEVKESHPIEKSHQEEIPHDDAIQDLEVVEEKTAEELKIAQKQHLQKLQADLKSIWGYLFEFPSKGDILHIESIPQRAHEIKTQTIQQVLMYLVQECSKTTLLKTLDTLVINLWECSTLTNQVTEKLASLISNNFKNIKHLELRFSGFSQLNIQGIQGFAEIWRKLPGLTHLTLFFSNCPYICEVRTLQSTIGEHLSHLQSLQLTFDNCILISDEGVNGISQHLGKLAKSLRNLNLSFANCPEISGAAFANLGSSISKKLPALENLELDFSKCPKVTDSEVKSLANSVPKYLKNLKHLQLAFNGCTQLSENGLQSLTTSLAKSHLKNLSFLSLKWDETQVSDKGMSDLAVCIGKTFLNLHHLELSFNKCNKLSDEGVNDIGVYLSNHLKGLNSLVLKFNNTPIYSRGVNGIGAYLGINLKSLEYLDLNLRSTNISDAGLSALGASFAQNFKKLNHLELSLRNCSNISDKGLNEFSTLLCSNLQNLTSLAIDLRDCPKISDTQFDIFKKYIKKNLPHFQHLKLAERKFRKIQCQV